MYELYNYMYEISIYLENPYILKQICRQWYKFIKNEDHIIIEGLKHIYKKDDILECIILILEQNNIENMKKIKWNSEINDLNWKWLSWFIKSENMYYLLDNRFDKKWKHIIKSVLSIELPFDHLELYQFVQIEYNDLVSYPKWIDYFSYNINFQFIIDMNLYLLRHRKLPSHWDSFLINLKNTLDNKNSFSLVIQSELYIYVNSLYFILKHSLPSDQLINVGILINGSPLHSISIYPCPLSLPNDTEYMWLNNPSTNLLYNTEYFSLLKFLGKNIRTLFHNISFRILSRFNSNSQLINN